jgi:hypothetical protein
VSVAFLLVLQAAAVPVDLAQARPVEPEAGLRTFVETCWRGLRDPAAFNASLAVVAPKPVDENSENGFRTVRTRDYEIYYKADVTCGLRFSVGTEAEAMAIADRLAERLGLRSVERHWAADASPSLALWQFKQVPLDRSYYALWVRAQMPPKFDAKGPYGIEISVSYGFGR